MVAEAGQTEMVDRDLYCAYRKLYRQVSAFFHGDDKGNATGARLEKEIRVTLAELSEIKGRVYS